MGTGRKFNKKSRTRPHKKPGDRRRRERNQEKRLLALGVPEQKVAKMTTAGVRTMLRHPARVASGD